MANLLQKGRANRQAIVNVVAQRAYDTIVTLANQGTRPNGYTVIEQALAAGLVAGDPLLAMATVYDRNRLVADIATEIRSILIGRQFGR